MPFDHAALPELQLRNRRLVAGWLLVVCGMIWVMVVIGGATRLTGSGLSIMEWAPLSGALPPMSAAEWQRLYDLYRTIPQYQLLNAGFGIEGFKQIFWLEWTHRLWGRLIGVVFLVPFLWFWWRGQLPRGLMPRLALLFVLGGLQGAIGWFMVASGFEADRTAVSPYRLVVHLGFALLLYGVILWTALSLLRPRRDAPPGSRPVAIAVHATAGLAMLAMLAGGFVAGIKAGLDYNTFPLMEGRLVPEGYAALSPFWRNLTANIAAVQFNHRLLATLALLAGATALVLGLRRLPASLKGGPKGGPGGGFARGAVIALGATLALQYALGILTLVHVVPAGLGTLHQGVAVGVLTAALVAMHALRAPRGAEGLLHPP